MKKYVLISMIVLTVVHVSHAHEPLYGFGPHVLFKGGFAPRITINGHSGIFETEYALGYGITRNWTMIAETPWRLEDNRYSFGGVNLKSKYRFWLKAKPGVSYQASFITKLELPAGDGRPAVLKMALTTGQEALKLYWFATAGYALKFTDDPLKPGNHIFYNVSIGFRPFKVNYYKPDIVFFIETTGNIFQKSTQDGDDTIKLDAYLTSAERAAILTVFHPANL